MLGDGLMPTWSAIPQHPGPNLTRNVWTGLIRATRYSAAFPVHAQIAQSVEQGIENPRVGGSIPSLGTKN